MYAASEGLEDLCTRMESIITNRHLYQEVCDVKEMISKSTGLPIDKLPNASSIPPESIEPTLLDVLKAGLRIIYFSLTRCTENKGTHVCLDGPCQ